jgi:hypothetical protein
LDYEKPICIIYNPHSGKKTNLVPRIEARLSKQSVKYEMMPTQKAGDTFTFARDIDFSKYSAVIAAGGDGTYHEVINGMLARKDGAKIPLGFIPNGSGNDLCTSLGIMDLEDSLDYICAKTVMKFDTIRVLADHESEEGIAPEDKLMYCRFMDINACMAMPARINFNAKPYKSCCGKMSYKISTMKLACSCNIIPDIYDVELDG